MTPRRLIEPARLAGSALLHTQTDERLVDLTRAGNDRAFEAIVSRYRGPLLRYCSKLLPPDRAEDAVQQTFLNAYTAIGAGESELKLRPWLYRVAHNASLNLLRQNGWSYDQIPEDFDGVMQPPQAVEQSERIREVVRAVQDLPDRQRDAIVLRELEGRSYEEISAALGVTDGAVRQLLSRGRTTLRGAVTSITPQQLLERFVDRIGGDAPTVTRVAELTAGAGGAMTLAKIGTAVIVAGAVAGGVATAPLHHSHSNHSAADAAEAAKVAAVGAGLVGGSGGSLTGGGARHGSGKGAFAHLIALSTGGSKQAPGVPGGTVSQVSGGVGSSGSGSGGGGNSGSGSSGSGSSGDGGHGGSDHSGRGSGDGGHSGSGSSGDGGSDHSGPGSGDGGRSGSGSSGSGSSGSGSSGSGSSGSGSSGSDSSGSDSSGSGSSGHGSGDSGHGGAGPD
jgi:RNA polymerase sigma factor (sigma-70 family)